MNFLDVDTPRFKAAIGSARYSPEENALVWSIKNFAGKTAKALHQLSTGIKYLGGKEYMLRAQFKLPSVTSTQKT